MGYRIEYAFTGIKRKKVPNRFKKRNTAELTAILLLSAMAFSLLGWAVRTLLRNKNVDSYSLYATACCVQTVDLLPDLHE